MSSRAEPGAPPTSIAFLTGKDDPAHSCCPQGPVERLVDGSSHGRGGRGIIHYICQGNNCKQGQQREGPAQHGLYLRGIRNGSQLSDHCTLLHTLTSLAPFPVISHLLSITAELSKVKFQLSGREGLETTGGKGCV